MKRVFCAGPLRFQDPVLLCAVLYVLLWFDASGFLRLGLCAAFLHECGHVLAYGVLFRELPVIEVTVTGFCMQTRGKMLTPLQTLFLAAAGPAANAFWAVLWAWKLSQHATIRGSAFLAAHLLTGAFNLLPIPPLDGAQMAAALLAMARSKNSDCNLHRNRVK